MLTSLNRRHSDGEASSEQPSPRVLLVDDDSNFRAWMSLLLRRLGFSVEVAVDGEDALAILGGAPFDLLIVDYEMPKLNGIELIREVRASPTLSQQYAIMLSAHEDVESKVTALTTGYDDFLSKSCTEVEVAAKVVAARRMLARNRILSAAATEWQRLASRDELTGVATRRALMVEAERCLADGRQIGIALIDLDEFKAVNDSFGHVVGDHVLRDLGDLFRRRTRSTELIARYGGDEFVLLVCDQTVDDIIAAADRLVREIATLEWTVGSISIHVRATTGIAHSSFIHSPTLEQILEVADRDLYAKKWLTKHPGTNPRVYGYAPGNSEVIALRAREGDK